MILPSGMSRRKARASSGIGALEDQGNKRGPARSKPGEFAQGRRTTAEALEMGRARAMVEGRAAGLDNRRVWTRDEIDKQERLVMQMVVGGHTSRAIILALRRQESVGRVRAKALVARAQDQMAAESAERRRSWKDAQIERITTAMREARGGPIYKRNPRTGEMDHAGDRPMNHQAVARYEAMLIQIQGTAEPEKVDVNIALTEAMKAVVGGLTSDELLELGKEGAT